MRRYGVVAVLALVVLLALMPLGCGGNGGEAADLVISGGTIVTMNESMDVIEDGAIAVKDGKISAIGKGEEIESQFHGGETIDATGEIVMPGLVNTHAHIPMVALRGYADDLPLEQWLKDNIWPAEAEEVTAQHVYATSRLATAEMIRSGTTTFNDMYFYEDEVAMAARDAGMRAVVGETLVSPGAFKNLGMGAVGRNVKLSVHELVRPSVDSDRCDACASCLKSCPADAISIDRNSKSAVIDLGPCIGCGECLTVCPNEAIQIAWKGDSTRAQQKLVEAASAVMRQKAGSICYFNFLLNITPSCDCFQRSAAPMVLDIGLLASLDPVAIDQASVDFTLKTTSARDDRYTDPSLRFLPVGGGSWDSAFDYAEALGLGSRSYKLIPL